MTGHTMKSALSIVHSHMSGIEDVIISDHTMVISGDSQD